jgi:hypothetical protein
MNAKGTLACPKCRRRLPDYCLTPGERAFCPLCKTDFHVEVFSALSFAPTIVKPESVALGADAACFFHAQNQAVSVCENCGRFLCEVCRVDFGGHILCSECIGGGGRHVAAPTEKQRVLYGSIALSLAFLPLLVWPLTLVTAPGAICLVVWAWQKPSSLVQSSRWRLILAAVFGIAQIIGWTMLFVHLATK